MIERMDIEIGSRADALREIHKQCIADAYRLLTDGMELGDTLKEEIHSIISSGINIHKTPIAMDIVKVLRREGLLPQNKTI